MTIKVTYNVTDVYMTQSVSPVYINISYSGGGSSGGGTWGTITGTLSNQTDLQNALNAKFDDPTGTTAQYLRGDGSLATFPTLTGYVPYTGATTNVDLGEYELKAGQLTLDVSPTGTAAVGTTRWNDTTGVSETTLKGGNVLLRNGVDLVARVVNKVSPNTTLTKAAYQAVRVSGAQGQRLAVAFAQANNDANSADTIGLVIETIPTNQEGFIMAVGQLENINTTGSLQGETWMDGDVLYLSPTTAGAITKVKPTGNGHIVVIGYVEYAHANNGKIYVKVMNGWELDELHDVSIVSVANNEALIYESSSALWKNKSISTALGYTPANAATTLTINGVTYDLSTSRTWTIAAGISGSGTAGQVTYWSGASAVSGSNNLFWDNTNNRLGIGTNAPAADIDLTKSSGATAFGSVGVRITNTSGTGEAFFSIRNQSFYAGFELFGDNYGVVGLRNTALFTTQSGVTYLGFATLGNAPIGFRTNTTSGTTNERLTILGNGNVAVNSTLDLGVRFGVVGDTLLRGSGATSATTALTVQNSSSTNLFTVRNDGVVIMSAISSPSNANFNFTVGNFMLNLISLNPQSNAGSLITTGEITRTDNQTKSIININNAVTSTSASFNTLNGYAFTSTINQTVGIIRGLYIAPTLTASTDFRAIETTNGKIIFGNLPTSSAGLPSGALWNNGGVINIV